MAVIKCENGHFYDNVKYSECPHCREGLHHIRRELYRDAPEDPDGARTVAAPPMTGLMWAEDITIPLTAAPTEPTGEGKTIGLYSFAGGTQLLTGWLVATDGPARGRDYRIFHGWNRIGRSPAMQIYVPEDIGISFENHGAIVYDQRKSCHYFVNEDGVPARVNGDTALGSVRLQNGDVIEIGNSTFTFIAFCTEERRWQDDAENG